TFANGNIGRGLRSLAAVELRTSTSQLNALPIFSQVGFMERLQWTRLSALTRINGRLFARRF
ncbi:hypothetical protein, partial [Pseudomonas viridiflava]|uniref:hypothetical protein n=1 Tax=Pseudomonas viridiflava TaxID=33069 RepID=UPI00198013E6